MLPSSPAAGVRAGSAFLLDQGQEIAEPGGELVGGPLEGRALFLLVAGHRGRIGDAPVDPLRIAGEDGAGFAGVVADRHHVVEALPPELVHVLGAMLTDVEAAFRHLADCHRMDPRHFRACARGLHPVPADLPEDGFRHLRPGAVVRAQEEDADAPGRLRRHPVRRAGGFPGEPGMEALAGGEVEMTQAFEVEAVIDVPAIGGAPALGDQGLGSKLTQVIGDEVGRLAHSFHELLDPAVAPGQGLDEAPAQLVGQEFEDGGGLGQDRGRHDASI